MFVVFILAVCFLGVVVGEWFSVWDVVYLLFVVVVLVLEWCGYWVVVCWVCC